MHDILDPTYGGGARVIGLLNGLIDAPEINKIVVVYPFEKTTLNTNISVYSYFSHRNFSLLNPLHHVNIADEVSPFRISKLVQIIKRYNIEILQNESVWGGINSIIVSNYCKIPLVLDAHNFEADYSTQINRNKMSQIYSRWLESLVVKNAEHILVVSEEDKRKIATSYNINFDKITVIPNGVDYGKFNNFKDSKTIAKNKLNLRDKFVFVFHGSLDYGPNKDAVIMINEFILPEIINKIPNAFFLIIGKTPPNLPYDKRFMRFTGYVPNLVDYLNACDIATVPLLRGGGTKLKVLDYLAAGLPIVATSKAVEGLPLENKVHALFSDMVDEEFINNILTLYNDPAYRKRLSDNSRNLAKKYDWKTIANTMMQVYKKLL